MATTAVSGTLRIASGLGILTTMGYAGFIHRSPWIIGIFGAVFAILYIQGKWPQWRTGFRVQPVLTLAAGLPTTLLVQTVLAAIVYFIGFGIGSLIAPRPVATDLQSFDWWLAAGLLAVAFCTGLIIHTIERRDLGTETSTDSEDTSGDDALAALQRQLSELGKRDLTMQVDIFSLARQYTDHPDRDAAIDALTTHAFDHQSAFVRRVGYTAIRFMGQDARDRRPDTIDQLIAEGMSDPALWVAYDAAGCSGEIEGDNAAYLKALEQLISELQRSAQDVDVRAETNDQSLNATVLGRAIECRESIMLRMGVDGKSLSSSGFSGIA